jgi:hypothetical protein
MTTPAQIEANQRNGRLSTGPKTEAGKARSAKNALRHGLRSDEPVLPGEDPDAWEAHRAGVVASLSPAGALEAELAGRVALSLWRLRRVAAYETAVTTLGVNAAAEDARADAPFGTGKSDQQKLTETLEALEKRRETVDLWDETLRLLQQLPDLPDGAPIDGDDLFGVLDDISGELPGAEHEVFDYEDKKFLAEVGVPADELDDPWNWQGWTAGMVRRAIDRMARHFKTSAAKLLARALESRQEAQDSGRAEGKRLEREAKELRARLRAQEDRLRQRRMLPDEKTLEKVLRYEAHASRQLLQALHTLERLQAARAGEPVPPPAALDVTVNGEAAPLLPGPRDAETAPEEVQSD